MKNTEKTQRNEHRGLQKGGLKKWLSGFLAVSTVVTMLTGQAVSFYGDEPDNAYALAGEGSEENITIHFGANEDTSISIHVNPENGEEDAAALAGLGSEMEGETDQLEELDSETETETEDRLFLVTDEKPLIK